MMKRCGAKAPHVWVNWWVNPRDKVRVKVWVTVWVITWVKYVSHALALLQLSGTKGTKEATVTRTAVRHEKYVWREEASNVRRSRVHGCKLHVVWVL